MNRRNGRSGMKSSRQVGKGREGKKGEGKRVSVFVLCICGSNRRVAKRTEGKKRKVKKTKQMEAIQRRKETVCISVLLYFCIFIISYFYICISDESHLPCSHLMLKQKAPLQLEWRSYPRRYRISPWPLPPKFVID